MSDTETPPPVGDADGLMGVNPSADLTVSDEKRDRGLKYVSKSRVKTYLQCPRKFWYIYWTQNRTPGNFYTERGTRVHQAFEDFHTALAEYVREHGERPDRFTPLLPNWRDFSQWPEMMGAFFAFEERRWQEAAMSVINDSTVSLAEGIDRAALQKWEPLGVEVEGWLGEPPDDYDRADPDHINSDGPPVGDIPWMGKADAILPSSSVPNIEGDGVVILDYKTGKVPKRRYRDEGIYLEGEFYGWLFEKFYDVDAVAGYYPQKDLLITSPYPNRQRRFDIKRAVLGMQSEPEIENFPIDEQPLCHYGHGKCYFYDECSSTWNE